MIFELDNVELNFGSGLLLSGIYLKCETGKITGILGSNGTGKSSLLKILFGSLRPQHSLLRINNKPIPHPFFTSGKVKYLPQKDLLPNHFKILNIFDYYKADWNDFIDMFPNFSHFGNSRVGKLSGGEKRILEIYLTLKSESDLVLLDEPFSHVAPLYIEQIKDLLKVEKLDKAVLLTDHMYRHVIETTNDLYLLKNGCTKYVEDLQDLENYRYLTPNTL